MDKHANTQPAEQFVASVQSVKGSEEEAAEIVRKAEERSAKLLAATREKAVEIGVKASDEAVKEKNRIIGRGRAETDAMVRKILEDARVRCEKISSRKLSDSDARELAQSIPI